jgi:hypothetical protein
MALCRDSAGNVHPLQQAAPKEVPDVVGIVGKNVLCINGQGFPGKFRFGHDTDFSGTNVRKFDAGNLKMAWIGLCADLTKFTSSKSPQAKPASAFLAL